MYCCLTDSERSTAAGCHILGEFAASVSRSFARAEHIREHGELVASGKGLAKMADGIKKLNE